MISVIISTYNRSALLEKAITSVLNQTYKDFEVLVMDDGSTDGTEVVVEHFKDKRINYIRLSHFGCDTHPKNEGIKQAKGEYIAFLDDDNEWRMDHLQALFNTLTRLSPEEKDARVCMVYGDRWVSFEDKDKKNQVGVYSEFDPVKLMSQNYIDTSDVLITKEALYDVGGFDESIKKFIDWNCWVRLVKAGYRFKRKPVILTDYHIHSGGRGQQANKSTTSTEGQYNPQTGLFNPTFDPINCNIVVGGLGEIRPLKVAIFSLVKDRLDMTKISFGSLKEKAGYPYDHFIVNQGSDKETREWLEAQDFKLVINNEKNMGIPYASNQAIDKIKIGDYDIIIKVDNDALFKTFNWLRDMIKVFEKMRPINLSPYIEGLIQNAGGVNRAGYGFIGGEFLGFVMHIGGICSAVPREVYNHFTWPDTAFMHGGNDVLLSSYLNNNGYQLAYMENHRVEHMEGSVGQAEKYPKYFKEREKETVTRTKDFINEKGSII